MSWGIAETAPEIEKIKAESADYLHGLESCGEIDWDVYNYAFDFYMDLIQKAYELGKEEAQSEPRVNKGKWIKITNTLYKCDQCGAVQIKGVHCKDCNAKMEVTA